MSGNDGLFSYDSCSKIIKDIRYLTDDFVPEAIIHRNSQIKEIAKSISQYLEYYSPFYLFIYGPPGTGKTTTIKFLFNKLREETKKVKGIYINCWKNSKGNSILLEMASQLDNRLTTTLQFKRSFSESYQLFKKYLELRNIKIILALDEIDKLEDMDILYVFVRDNIPLIMVSNDAFALSYLDERIRSSLLYESIEFKAYSFEEIYDILRNRHKYAFYPDSFPPEYIRVCASNAKGDARIGIGMMRVAALIAEKKGKDKVEIEDIRESKKEADKLKARQILSTLKREHECIYNIIVEKGEIQGGELYKEYLKHAKEKNLKILGERTFRNYLHDLILKGLIESSGETRWKTYYLKIQ